MVSALVAHCSLLSLLQIVRELVCEGIRGGCSRVTYNIRKGKIGQNQLKKGKGLS